MIRIIYIYILIIYSSCGGENPIPKDVFPPEKMATIMTDIHLAEGAVVHSPDIRFEPRQRAVDYYYAVRKIHGIDTAAFRYSFEFYARHPQHFSKVYDQVLENLHQLQLKK